jgi:hypothetical protein
VPLKFSLGGDRGLNISSPVSASVEPCDGAAPGDTLESTDARQASATTRGPAGPLQPQTARAWAGTCRRLASSPTGQAARRVPLQ